MGTRAPFGEMKEGEAAGPKVQVCDLEFSVDGMTCAACTSRVKRALKKVSGVRDASVNLATNRATVSYDPSLAGPADLASAVSAAGYIPVPERVDLFVEAMTDAGAERRVSDALRSIPGVLAAEARSVNNTVSVSLLGSKVSSKDLQDALSRAGYASSVLKAAKVREERARGPQASLRRSLVISAVLSLPVLILSMGFSFFPSLRFFLSRFLPMPFGARFLEFVLTVLVFFGPGFRFVKPGLAAYRHGAPDMNSLVLTGTGAAFGYSTLVTFFPGLFPVADRHVYFDSAAVVITVILLGRYLEALAKGRTGRSIEALLKLAPGTVTLVTGSGERTVSAEEVHPGDRVRVRPGERIPVDGTILDGTAHIDQSMMTGEPVPVARGPGDPAVCGTVNTDSLLTIEAVSVGGDTRLAQIIRAVERAQGAKLPVQRLADRIVAVFTPIVLFVAASTFIAWFFLGERISGGSALAMALVSSVSVLVVACPCAMGLATPAAVMVGSGRGAELGILFRKGEALEILSEVDTILFDKTGTLTLGKPRIMQHVPEDLSGLLPLAASLESASIHPLARAIVIFAADRGVMPVSPEWATAVPGEGMKGRVDGREILIGSRSFLEKEKIDLSRFGETCRKWEEDGLTLLLMARDGEAEAVFGVSDPPKPEAKEVVLKLLEKGLDVRMVTGDQQGSAKSVAERIGIRDLFSQVSPERKSAIVGSLRHGSRKVAFVGDGINDGPALAAADVGIALGSGTDVAIEAADVTLAGSDLRGVLTAIELSGRTMRTIRVNLVWAFLYNILLIPLASGVFRPTFGIGLDPMLAGTAMGLSSVFVVTNSLRLRTFSRKE